MTPAPSLSNDPTVIRKFHPKIGEAYWSTVTRTWVLNAEGQPIPVPKPPKRPTTPRVITLARKVIGWDKHETGGSMVTKPGDTTP
jgi:hypothetical protein